MWLCYFCSVAEKLIKKRWLLCLYASNCCIDCHPSWREMVGSNDCFLWFFIYENALHLISSHIMAFHCDSYYIPLLSSQIKCLQLRKRFESDVDNLFFLDLHHKNNISLECKSISPKLKPFKWLCLFHMDSCCAQISWKTACCRRHANPIPI